MKRSNYYYVFIIVFITNLIGLSTKWALNTYSKISIDEIIFHLNVPLTGTEHSLVNSFISASLIPTILISVLLLVFFIFLNKWIKKNKIEISLDIKDYKKKFIINNEKFMKNIKLINISLLIMFLSVLINSIRVLEIDVYVRNMFVKSDFIKDHYSDPREVEFEFPKTKRNLIHIVVESFESTYFNTDKGGQLKNNLLSKLEPYMKKGTYFSDTENYGGGFSLLGTTWTIAGLVTQTSGMPLKLQSTFTNFGQTEFTNVYQKSGYTTFLNGTYSLGEILKDNGYNNMLVIGSDKAFGSRELYYTQHGDYEIFDYYSAIAEGKIPDDYHEWWGFEDSKLFKYSKEKLLKLSKESEPFNFSVLTANTHFPDGYVEDSCKANYKEQYSNSISCSVDQIVDFIKWIEKQDFYENTTIVITGDHLSMDAEFFKNISADDRRVFNLFLNTPIKTDNTNNRQFSSLDIFPTILSSLGVKYNSSTLGLGVDLFSDNQTLIEKYGLDYVYEELSKKSIFYDNKIIYGK